MYYYATSRRQLAEILLERAGYNPADFEGWTAAEIAAAVEGIYREWADSGEAAFPTWEDGDEIDIARYVEAYLASQSE